MRIVFVVTGFGRTAGTAGHAVIFAHANGLAALGHDVRIAALRRSGRPEWFDLRVPVDQVDEFALARKSGIATFRGAVGHRMGRVSRNEVRSALAGLVRPLAARSTAVYTRAADIDGLARLGLEADVTLATGFPTALPVALHGSGVRAYFMQHYEVLFAPDLPESGLAEKEAQLSYGLPLAPIANSTWLAGEVRRRHGLDARVCPNGLDVEALYRDGGPDTGGFTVASYSGRGVAWKGFADAAEAIRIARETVPDLRWRVFGSDAALPPDNPIAAYEDVGYLDRHGLRRLFSGAHACLCPSWYESFPMYPLEAMACETPVVTTPLGAEDYVANGVNCLVVPPRDPAAMAAALVRLWSDEALRSRLAVSGRQEALRHPWSEATARLEQELFRLVAAE